MAQKTTGGVVVQAEACYSAVGPAWTRGEGEAPAGEKTVGTSVQAVFTPEQQARLRVDEEGRPQDLAKELVTSVLEKARAARSRAAP